MPAAGVFFIISVIVGGLGWLLRSRRSAVIFVNLAAAFLSLAIFEGYLAIEDFTDPEATRIEGSAVRGFVQADELLGYAPTRSTTARATKLRGDTVVYDVVYTTDRNGLRSMPRTEPSPQQCVVFFGDSFTFGDGVPDTATFPYLVGMSLAGQYATYNFAFSGYGPHQMLALLQSGRVEGVVGCTPRYFVYLCIPDHVARVAGLPPRWHGRAPRFRLTADGKAIRDGSFDGTGDLWVPRWLAAVLNRSRIWQRSLGRERGLDTADFALLDAVIAESARTARQRFPNSEFHVLLWWDDEESAQPTENRLKDSGIFVHRLGELLGNPDRDSSPYVIANDGHFNPHGHRLIADYIAASIVRAISK